MKLTISKSQWEEMGKKTGWNVDKKQIKTAMNIKIMNEEVEKLKLISPTKFVKVYIDFWATALQMFKKHLPDNHKMGDAISLEAVEAFKKCVGGIGMDKLKIYENK